MNELIPTVHTAVTATRTLAAPAYCDPETDLRLHLGCGADSCFVVANLAGDDGNTYNFLIHQGAMIPSGDGSYSSMVAMVSLTDRAARQYLHAENSYPFNRCTFSGDHLEIRTPSSALSGDLDTMSVSGDLPDGRGSINAELVNQGPALQNCGNGLFRCMNDQVTFHHYGLPYLKATGTIVLDGRAIAVAGDAWLDRQWSKGTIPTVMLEGRYQTKWMDLNLDNGYKVSLWDILVDGGTENSWATVLAPDGTHIVAPMTPLARSESDFWRSDASGNCYPTRCVVEIPGVGARIDVAVYEGIPQQESVSSAGYNRYEAHSTCKGTFMGDDVTGFCCIEYVGDHRDAAQVAAEKDKATTTSGRLDESVNGTFKAVMHSPMGDQDIVFHYETDGDKLTGSVDLMGKTSPVKEGHATSDGFTHKFKMKVPVGSANVTITGHVDGDQLLATLKSPMGKLPLVGRRQ